MSADGFVPGRYSICRMPPAPSNFSRMTTRELLTCCAPIFSGGPRIGSKRPRYSGDWLATPGWTDLDSAQQDQVAAPLTRPLAQAPTRSTPIPQVRAETEACPARLLHAVEELLRMVDGNRVVRVAAAGYFAGGVETSEQLDAALTGLRQECERLIGAGMKVLVQ